MADTIELEVVTPERQLVKESVTEAQIPAKEGYIGVLPGHAPLLSLLGSGVLTYTPQAGAAQSSGDPWRLRGSAARPHPRAGQSGRARRRDRPGKGPRCLKQANERLTSHDQAGATDPAVALAESELAQARVTAAELR